MLHLARIDSFNRQPQVYGKGADSYAYGRRLNSQADHFSMEHADPVPRSKVPYLQITRRHRVQSSLTIRVCASFVRV